MPLCCHRRCCRRAGAWAGSNAQVKHHVPFLLQTIFLHLHNSCPLKTPSGNCWWPTLVFSAERKPSIQSRTSLAQSRVYPANGLAVFTRGFVLPRFHPHEVIDFIFCNTCKGIFKVKRERKDRLWMWFVTLRALAVTLFGTDRYSALSQWFSASTVGQNCRFRYN